MEIMRIILAVMLMVFMNMAIDHRRGQTTTIMAVQAQ